MAKTARVELRASEDQRALLRAASAVSGLSVSDFVLSHATSAAENVLADRQVFPLDETTWRAFEAMLDRPPREVCGLRELLTAPSVFDEE